AALMTACLNPAGAWATEESQMRSIWRPPAGPTTVGVGVEENPKPPPVKKWPPNGLKWPVNGLPKGLKWGVKAKPGSPIVASPPGGDTGSSGWSKVSPNHGSIMSALLRPGAESKPGNGGGQKGAA